MDGSTLPLFFKNPVPLGLARHEKAGVSPTADYFFAADSNSIVIGAVEFLEAAKCYPIVFTQGEVPIPAVILGLESRNYFVDENGRWAADSYIPAYVRKYPFIFMDRSAQKQFVLCIDEAAPQYKKSGGKNTQPLYEQQKPSRLTQNALEFCTAFHNHHVLTRPFCEALRDAGLLAPSKSVTKLASGRTVNLANFQIIDEQKLSALPDETIIAFHKKGWLPLIHFALMSGSNWKKLADRAEKRESTKSPAHKRS